MEDHRHGLGLRQSHASHSFSFHGQDHLLQISSVRPRLPIAVKQADRELQRAYEISTIHNKEPPPREILEDISARGGNLLTRTIENYPLARKGLEDDEGEGTPNADKVDVVDPSSSRAARGENPMARTCHHSLNVVHSWLAGRSTTATALSSGSSQHVSTRSRSRRTIEFAEPCLWRRPWKPTQCYGRASSSKLRAETCLSTQSTSCHHTCQQSRSIQSQPSRHS